MSLFVIIGWIGAVSFVIAYFLLSIHILSANKVLYHLLNAVGALCLVINSVFLNDGPNFFVNIIWMGIAIYSTGRIINHKKRLANIKN